MVYSELITVWQQYVANVKCQKFEEYTLTSDGILSKDNKIILENLNSFFELENAVKINFVPELFYVIKNKYEDGSEIISAETGWENLVNEARKEKCTYCLYMCMAATPNEAIMSNNLIELDKKQYIPKVIAFDKEGNLLKNDQKVFYFKDIKTNILYNNLTGVRNFIKINNSNLGSVEKMDESILNKYGFTKEDIIL